jgi:hypothetical protein
MTEVRLDTQEWNQLLQILAQAPWSVANPLIMKIGEQLRAAQPQPGLANPVSAEGHKGNSADKVEH